EKLPMAPPPEPQRLGPVARRRLRGQAGWQVVGAHGTVGVVRLAAIRARWARPIAAHWITSRARARTLRRGGRPPFGAHRATAHPSRGGLFGGYCGPPAGRCQA